MKYREVVRGVFIDRPNRFIAHVEIDGKTETVHVKNTGRCRELLLHGAIVYLEKADNPKRKTKYDLIAVEKPATGVLFNIDSQAPNKVVLEHLLMQGYSKIVPEYTYGNSRIDFYMEPNSEKYLMEVKGCTLEIDGVGYFPDAPTQRGTRHIRELIRALEQGYHAVLAFVIQMEGVYEVRPNAVTDPEFAAAMEEAKQAGVEVVFYHSKAAPDELLIVDIGKEKTSS